MVELYGIAIVICIIQFFLSRTKHVLFGGILPVIATITLSYMWLKNIQDIRNDVYSFVILTLCSLVVLLTIWISGRESVKKKRDKEIKKIDIQNLS